MAWYRCTNNNESPENGDNIKYPTEVQEGATKLYTESYISDIASAIVAKTRAPATYTTEEMSTAINNILAVPTLSFSYIGDGREPNTNISFNDDYEKVIFLITAEGTEQSSPSAPHNWCMSFMWGSETITLVTSYHLISDRHIVHYSAWTRGVQYINNGRTMRLAGYPNHPGQILNYPGIKYTVYYADMLDL